jgi:hypothetical protein
MWIAIGQSTPRARGELPDYYAGESWRALASCPDFLDVGGLNSGQ